MDLGLAGRVALVARGVSIGRLVTAAEVADVVAFLASPRSVAINAGRGRGRRRRPGRDPLLNPGPSWSVTD